MQRWFHGAAELNQPCGRRTADQRGTWRSGYADCGGKEALLGSTSALRHAAVGAVVLYSGNSSQKEAHTLDRHKGRVCVATPEQTRANGNEQARRATSKEVNSAKKPKNCMFIGSGSQIGLVGPCTGDPASGPLTDASRRSFDAFKPIGHTGPRAGHRATRSFLASFH